MKNTNKYGLSSSLPITIGGTKESGAKITLKYRSRDQLLGLAKWDRAWFFNIINNSSVTWTDDEGNILKTAPDGCRLVHPSGALWLSVKSRHYTTFDEGPSIPAIWDTSGK